MTRYILATIASTALATTSCAALAKDRFEIGGQLLMDADHYEAFWSKDGERSTTEAQLRNLRVQFNYDFPAGWEGKLQIDGEAHSDDQDIDIGSAYMRYTQWNVADVTLGRMKEPIGFERNTSSSKLQTIEGAMISSAFTPGKSWGIHLYNANEKRRWALAAVVEDDQDNQYTESTPTALSGRFTWSPINTTEQTLQIGGSGSVRDWKGNNYQVRERAEVGTADTVVRSAEFIADNETLIGVEGLWRHNSAQLQGEYIATRVEERNGPDWNYSGYYITGSYLLTGELRRFRDGEFRSLRPLKDSGAWELVARHSFIDVRERDLGSKASVTTLGVNYYYGRHMKVMLAYLHPDISGSVRHNNTEGDALSMRFQLRF